MYNIVTWHEKTILMCTIYVTVWVKIRLVCTWQHFEKYHFKNSIKKTSLALVLESFIEHNNTSHLLVFVQLTWQVGNGWFLAVFMIFFMEFINIGPVYIRGWVGWVVAKLNQRRKKTQLVEFRVAMSMTCTYTHKRPIFHYKA